MNKSYALPTGTTPWSSITALLVFATMIAIYPIVRYSGLWGEIDSHAATFATRSIMEAGSINPGAGWFKYPNGFAFQTTLTFLSNISGVSLPTLQIFGSAFLAIWVVIPAWLLYRELTRSSIGATLTTALILVQPEFVFALLRATHEKFTRGLMFFALYLLVRSLRSQQRIGVLVAVTISFYLAIFGVLTLNNLLSASFTAALTCAFVAMWLASRIDKKIVDLPDPMTLKLRYAVVGSLILVFLNMFYLYVPSKHGIDILSLIVENLTALLRDVEETATSPYARWVAGAWVNTSVYVLVSLANWLLLGVSAIIWLYQTFLIITCRWKQYEISDFLLWGLYTALAFLGALSVVVDYTGVLSGNLQHRIFPTFAMIAAPLVVRHALLQWHRVAPYKQPIVKLLVSLVAILAVLSTLKATNEPLVSNKWLFYTPSELRTIQWAEAHLAGNKLWTEFDERLRAGLGVRYQTSQYNTKIGELGIDEYLTEPDVRSLLLSDITRARAVRLGMSLPIEADSLITYDNGQAQVYHLRPRTPYQR